MRFTNSLLISLLIFCVHNEIHTISAKAQTGIPIEGRVVYPDGTGAGGANVVAVSNCANTSVHLVQETITSSDGKFLIKSFDPTCNRYKFSTSQSETFWLPTGDEFFYLAPNGTTPTIELMPGKMPAFILLGLEQRGGKVELRVFDKKTGAFIYAGFSIHREPVPNKTFDGGMSDATGDGGSSHTLFLPPGNYVAGIDRFKCRGKNYFSAKPQKFKFTVKAGMREAMTMNVNIANIQTKSSYDNPGAELCSQ